MTAARTAMHSREDLARDLLDAGLGAGETVLVHSSLHSLGRVADGPPTVVQAILDVLGQQGTLVVPAMTANNRDPSTWNPPPPKREWARIRVTLPPFDPAKTPSFGVGAIAEQVRRWPGSARSAHPQSSFAAVGMRAAELMADHRLESHLGEDSPLPKLVAIGARVLLLGVGYATTTAFHLGEYRRRNPPMRDYSCAVLHGGERAWVTFRDVDLDDSDFEDLGKAFEYDLDVVDTGRVGKATTKLFTVCSAVDFAGSWMHRNRPDGTPENATRGPV